MTNEELTNRIAASTKPLVLLDFHADWCGACQVLMPLLDKFAIEHPEKIEIIKINVDGDGNRELARVFNIASIPALFLYKDGHVVERNTITAGNLIATVLRHV